MRIATPLASVVAIACVLALGAPVLAQSKENLRKLSQAYQLLQDEETKAAIDTLNTVIEDAPEDSDAAAKAMLLRGQAYAKAGRHTQALADFNAALWLQGLSSSQRKQAVEGRKAALAKLGLGDDDSPPGDAPAEESTESVRVSASRATTGSPAPEPSAAPASASWQTEVKAAKEPQSDGIGSFFSNLFGGESEPASEQTASIDAPTEPSAASGWSTSTAEVSETPAETRAPAPDDARSYRVQIASVGSREGAESEAKRLSRILGDAMAGETPSIVRTDTDAGNTYYRIMVGPKPSRDDATEMCQMFKSRGVDCLVLSRR